MANDSILIFTFVVLCEKKQHPSSNGHVKVEFRISWNTLSASSSWDEFVVVSEYDLGEGGFYKEGDH